MAHIPFEIINWKQIQQTEHPGEKGISFWQTVQHEGLRIRVVTYNPGYLADHWCHKGHIVHCIEGSFICELKNGESVYLSLGMTYVVSDDLSAHRSYSENGVKLFIVDGDFLSNE